MSSLFDLAAELSQYDETREPPLTASDYGPIHNVSKYTEQKPARDKTASPSVPTNNQNGDGSLSLLDETLLTIYAARQPPPLAAQVALPPTLVPQRSASQLLRDRSITDQSSRTVYPTTTPTPLQNVFAQSVTFRSEGMTKASSGRTIPLPPPLPPTDPTMIKAPVGRQPENPDATARRTLREIHEEIEQLPREALTSPRRIHRLQRSLSEKYLQDRLNTLPSTPFVQLARKKTQQKIDHLRDQSEKPTKEVKPENQVPPSSFPRDQHERLLKLAQIPDTHVAKLSTTQQHMVQFAKRYDKILALSSEELQKLSVSQAQLLQQLQQQLQASRNMK